MKKWKLQIMAVGLLTAGILLTVFSGEASDFTLDGLLLCAEKVVPSLFPPFLFIPVLLPSLGVEFQRQQSSDYLPRRDPL